MNDLCTCGTRWSLPMDAHQPGIDVEHQRAELADSTWHRLAWRERLRLLPILVDVWFVLSYYTGIRDRLRCPKCKAVGTWKMHGTLLERWVWGDIHVRRWLCKWCGHYIGPRGRVVAHPGSKGAWALPAQDELRQPTPAEVVKAHMGKTWPWVG